MIYFSHQGGILDTNTDGNPKIKEYNGIKYRLEPLYVSVIDSINRRTGNVTQSHEEYFDNYNIKYLAGDTDTLDFRFAMPGDEITISFNPNIRNIHVNSANIGKMFVWGKNTTYNFTIHNNKKSFISNILFARELKQFLSFTRLKIESIHFEGINTKILTTLIEQACQKYHIKNYTINTVIPKLHSLKIINSNDDTKQTPLDQNTTPTLQK